MAEISLRNTVKRYADGFVAVDGVSLDIADGEFVILVGPSGCGKSTLLRMIVGLEDVTAGDVLIGGERVNDRAPRERNLAMVFQNYALYPHLTVHENIAFPLRLRGELSGAEIRDRVAAAAEVLQLSEHLDRKPAQLSGGQRQRVAMGRAIVREAGAFLFDEPLSNLDAKLRGQMRTEILRLQRRLGITTVYVTHDQTEAMTLGDRVAVLRRGTLSQVGTPRELYERPANLFVAGFIGSPAMNFVAGTIRDGRMDVPFASFELPAGLRDAVGDRDQVTVGIRPASFQDAARLDGGGDPGPVTFRAQVDVVEWLGNEQYAYIPYEGLEREVEARLAELARELDSERMRNQLIVALDPDRAVRAGDDVELAIEPDHLHLFDAETGESLTARSPSGDQRDPVTAPT